MTATDKLIEEWEFYRGMPAMRLGQAFMNALFDVDRDSYSELYERGFDCFFTDDSLFLALQYVLTKYGDK